MDAATAITADAAADLFSVLPDVRAEIDGHKLAQLMIEHGFGVSTRKIYEIKAVDSDVFNEYVDEE